MSNTNNIANGENNTIDYSKYDLLPDGKCWKVFSAFDGYGGITMCHKRMQEALPFELDNVGISEINKMAIKVNQILNGPSKNYGDITKINFKKLPMFHVYYSSSPCTDVSPAGKGAGFAEGSGTASALIWEDIRMLDEVDRKPFLIIKENSKGITFKKYRESLTEFVKALEDRGYTVKWKVLNANDFGSPEHRERFYLVATLCDIGFEFPEPIEEKVYLKDYLEQNSGEEYLISFKSKRTFISRSLHVHNADTVKIHNPSFCEVAQTITTKSGYRPADNFVFLNDMGKQPTIRVTNKYMMEHNITEDQLLNCPIRRLTKHEVEKIMGFREDEIALLDKAKISRTAISELLGNGYSLQVVTQLLIAVFSAIEEAQKKKQQVKKSLYAKMNEILALHNKMKAAYFFQSPRLAADRRRYEERNSLETSFTYKGHIYKVSQITSCSCSNVYYQMSIYIDGIGPQKDIRLIKGIIRELSK